MRYTSIVCVLGLFLIGCAKEYCPRVPEPPAPEMKKVAIEGGVIRGKSLDNTISNMLELQRYADELGICPCWEVSK